MTDLRYSLRRLWRSPGHITTAAFCLAIGIAASASVFSMLNAVVYRELPGIADRRSLRNVYFRSTSGEDSRALSSTSGYRALTASAAGSRLA